MYHRWILSHNHAGSSPMASPLNLTLVPTVTYEYLICLLPGERLSHPLDGRLGGYYQGPVLWVPWAAIYGPTNLDMA
jgi:hypothetical protein